MQSHSLDPRAKPPGCLDALLRQLIRVHIALARGARLATRNTRHFDDTTIGLVNPFLAAG